VISPDQTLTAQCLALAVIREAHDHSFTSMAAIAAAEAILDHMDAGEVRRVAAFLAAEVAQTHVSTHGFVPPPNSSLEVADRAARGANQ
jgi:hypothetical protein